jgi:hypothetical protein
LLPIKGLEVDDQAAIEKYILEGKHFIAAQTLKDVLE